MQQIETTAPAAEQLLPIDAIRPRRSRTASLLHTARKYPLVTFMLSILSILALIAIFAPVLAPYSQYKTHPEVALQSPTIQHWLGTDALGRDTLSRVIFGIRVSLQVGVIAVAIGAVFGITMGLIAGYVGGLADQLLSRYIDAQLAFPGILLALAIANSLGPGLYHAMWAVGILGIPGYMRLTRGQVLQAREFEYVTAAKLIGAGRTRIMTRHILPNIFTPLLIVGSLAAGGAILAEAALSFLGIGAQPPTPDLGSMINTAKDYLQNQAWLSVGPGVAIFLIVWSFANLGDALSDALNPRLKER